MTPRQPYRSPFWQQEAAAFETAPQVSRATRAGQSMSPAERPASPPAAKRLGVGVNAEDAGYAASDLALFNRLMPTSGQSQPRQVIANQARGAAPRQQDAAPPERGRAVRPTAAQSYSDADNAKFLKLQSGFANVRSGLHQADSGQPDGVSANTAHGYSQRDMEAFERLARFRPGSVGGRG